MPSKKSTPKTEESAAEEPISFEDALSSLEELVSTMEGDDLPLETMIANYQEGVRLRDLCAKQLEDAQSRVELIRNRKGQAAELTNFETGSAEKGAANASEDAATNETGSSDGELF